MDNITTYIIARWAYSVGDPIMSDAEYNILDKLMHEKYPTLEYCQRSWSSDPCPIAVLKANGREDLIQRVVLSDKTESIPSLNSKLEVRNEWQGLNTKARLSYKLDGWNIQHSYYNGQLVHIQTRGRSTDSMDATQLMDRIPAKIDIPGRVLVTSEAVIPNNEFPWFQQHFGVTSQRGAVSTALANYAAAKDHMAVIAHGLRSTEVVPDIYERLQQWGFTVPNYQWVSDYYELNAAIESMGEYAASYPYPTDGLVLDDGKKVRAIRIGRWEEPIYKSFVTSYAESYGPHSIAIQANIWPIKLPNSVQRKVPLTNLSRVIQYNLRPGAPIAFRIASSAIADFDEAATVLLHQQYADRWLEYQEMVKQNELLK